MKRENSLVWMNTSSDTEGNISYFRIGHIVLDIPPANIEVNKQHDFNMIGGLRTGGDTIVNSGYSKYQIIVKTNFYGPQQIEDRLLPIIGMYKVCPIIDVDNKFIRNQLFGGPEANSILGGLPTAYSYNMALSMVLDKLTLTLIPNLRGLNFEAVFVFNYYNHLCISPTFNIDIGPNGYSTIDKRVKRWISKTKQISEVSAAEALNLREFELNENEMVLYGYLYKYITIEYNTGTGGQNPPPADQVTQPSGQPNTPPKTPTEPDPVDPTWINVAMGQINTAEIAGDQANSAILGYWEGVHQKQTQDEVPWCSAFMNWVMMKSGRKGTGNAFASSWLNWGKPLSSPKRGAIVILRTGNSGSGYHVGIYMGDAGRNIKVLGGNQGGSGGRVKVSLFSKSTVAGYRWPSNEQVTQQPTLASNTPTTTVTTAEMSEATKQEMAKMETEGWVVDKEKSNFYCIVYKKPYGIPFFNDSKGEFIYNGAGPNSPWYNPRSRVLIQSISIGYANKTVPVPLMGFNLPFWQHLGAGNMMVSVNAIAIADEQTGTCPVLEEVQALFNVKEEQVLRNKGFVLYDPKYTNEIQTVGVYSLPLNMVGFNRAILTNLSVSTIDHTPNAFNVDLSFIENYMYDASLHDRSSAMTVLENRILPDLIQQALLGSKSTDIINEEVKEAQRKVKSSDKNITDFTHMQSDSSFSQEQGMVLNLMRRTAALKDGMSFLRPLVRITGNTADSAMNTASSFTTPQGFVEALGMAYSGLFAGAIIPLTIGKDFFVAGGDAEQTKFNIAKYGNLYTSSFLGSGAVETYDEVVGNNANKINTQMALGRALKEEAIRKGFMSDVAQQYSTITSKAVSEYNEYAAASDYNLTSPLNPGGAINPIAAAISEVATTYLSGLIDGISSLFGTPPAEEYLKLWDKYSSSESIFSKIKDDIRSGNINHPLWSSFVKDNLYVGCYRDLLLENNENPADYLQAPGETDSRTLTDMYSMTTTASQAIYNQITQHYMSLPQYKVMSAARDKNSGTVILESKPMDKTGLFKEVDGKSDYNKAMDYVDSMIKTNSEGLKKMMKEKYDYNRSFPTYKVFLVEDGASEGDEAIMRQWDQFFDYSAITEIEVVRFKHDVDVAVVKMLNTFGQLTTRVLESGLIVEPTKYKDISMDVVFDKSGRVQRDEAGNLVKVDLEGNMTPISRMFLQAGTKIVIKMGYSNNEEDLPVVFTGLVSDVQPGDVVTVICQGFLSELLVPLENYLGDYVGGLKGRLQTLTGTEPGSDFLTSIGIPAGIGAAGIMYALPTAGLSLIASAAVIAPIITRRIAKMLTINQSHTYWLAYTVLSHPAALHFGSWDFIGYKNKNGNNYLLGSEWQLLTGKSTRCVANVDLKLRDNWQVKSSIIDMFPALDSFSVNDPQNTTLWEVLREAVYRHPSHIITVRPYGSDATLIIKQPTDVYKTSVVKFTKPTVDDKFESDTFTNWVNKNYDRIKSVIEKYTDPNGKGVLINRRIFKEFYNWDPSAWDKLVGWSYDEVPEFCTPNMALYYIQKSGDPSMMQCFMPDAAYQDLNNQYMLYKKSLIDTDPTLKNKLNMGDTSRPVRKYFYASDRRNMLFNNIRTNENIYNAVRVKIKEDEEDAFIQAVDDDVPDRYIRPFSYTSKNLQDNASSGGRANELKGLYAFSILIEKLNEMYRGEIAILGEPDIMPFDAVVLDDRINQLYGTFEVASVTHRFTQSEGFITFIEPHFQCRVSDAALAAATGATEDLVRINNINQYYYIMEAENRKRDLYGQYAYGIIGNVDQDVNMDQILSSAGELAYNLGMLARAAEKVAPMIFGDSLSEIFFKLSNKAYNAGPFRQPIIIEPLTFRTVPFVAGIRGYLYNGWFDSASIKVAAIGRELAQDLVHMNMGIRHLFKEADYVIESGHRRIIKTP